MSKWRDSKYKHILVRGYKGVTTKGSPYEVLEYIDYRHCKIINSKGLTFIVTPNAAISGRFKDPTYPSVMGVGYIGIGKYKPWMNSKKTKEYQIWSAMLLRCYDKLVHKKKPKYSDCSVCEEWHNFQNFAEWCNSQPNFGLEGYHLDKDLKVLGNKNYNPQACSFIPSKINCLFTNSNSEYKLVGVNNPYKLKGWAMEVKAPVFQKETGETTRVIVKYTKCEQDAYTTYKEQKERYVKDLANFYKQVLDPEVYTNLINWSLPEFSKI